MAKAQGGSVPEPILRETMTAVTAGIMGAIFEVGGEGVATAGEGLAAGVGIAKFFGVDLGTFLYGYFRACHP